MSCACSGEATTPRIWDWIYGVRYSVPSQMLTICVSDDWSLAGAAEQECRLQIGASLEHPPIDEYPPSVTADECTVEWSLVTSSSSCIY